MLSTLLIFIIVLGLLVFVHELGHFLSAKKLGAGVEEFGFGFPPRAIGVYKEGKKWKFVGRKTPKTDKTIYSFNWIPLGGFVKIKGEDGEDKKDPKSFASKPIWKRAVILSAGVTMNIILAMAILAVGFGIGMPQVLEKEPPSSAQVRDRSIQIVSVEKDTPAYLSGFKAGDEILSLDGKQIKLENIPVFLEQNVGEEVEYQIKRNKEVITLRAVVQILENTDAPGIGIGIIETGVVSYPWYIAIYKGIAEALYFVKEIIIAFALLFKNLIFGKGVSTDISGPVGIAVLTGRVAKLGLIYLMQFTALLSINLAILNALPFPALDGGRLLFLAIEKVRGKPVSQKVEAMIHNLGFLLLMILVIVVTYRDFAKFSYKFVNLWQSIIN